METKKRTNIGFWAKTSDYGKFYTSVVVNEELLELLKKAELGGQLKLSYNNYEDRSDKSPDMTLSVVTKADVESRRAKATKPAASKQKAPRQVESEV